MGDMKVIVILRSQSLKIETFGEKMFLFANNGLPHEYVSTELQPSEVAKSIVAKHTDLDIRWVNPSLFHAYTAEGSVCVAYFAQIPNDQPIKNGSWITLLDAKDMDKMDQRLLSKAILYK
jgi:hypothetical protein